MNRSIGTRWLLVLLVAVSLTLVSVAADAEDDAKALFEKRCSLCHPASRPLGMTKTPQEWSQTVTRMKGYAGGKISDEEGKIITKYLSEIRGK